MPNDLIEQKVVSMLDALQNGAVEIGGKVVKYAPDIGDAILMIVRINSIQDLVFPIFGAAFLAYMYRYMRRLWAYAKESDSVDVTGIVFICSATYAFCVAAIYNRLTYIWTWVGIFEPKLALAKQIMDAALATAGAK